MIRNVAHIAIAVKSLEQTLSLWERTLGLKPSQIGTVPEQGVRLAMIPVGDCLIEIMEPSDAEGGVAKFIERRGEGIHHICFEVEDVDAELGAMAEKGVELIDKAGRKGFEGKVGFIHPRSLNGLLIELLQKV